MLPNSAAGWARWSSNAARCYGLVNPTSTLAEPFIGDLQAGAARLGVEVEILRASTGDEIDAAFANLPRQPGSDVLVVSTDPFFISGTRKLSHWRRTWRCLLFTTAPLTWRLAD